MKLNLRTKLIGSLVIILLLMVVVGLTGTYTAKTIRDRLDNIIEQDIKPANILGDVGRRAGFVRANSLLHLFARSIDDMNRYESEVADWVGKINTDLNTLENIFKDQATLDKFAEFRTAWDTYLRIWREQVVPLSRENRDEEAFALARKEGIAGTAAQGAMYNLDELHNVNVAAANHRLKLANQDSSKNQHILLAVTLFAIIFGLAFGIRQGSLIADSVNAVSKAAQRVAAGDLDQRLMIKTGDEIESMANSFNTMTVKLKTMVEELQREITERRRAEDRLRESEQWLSTTLRSIGDAVIATDAKGLVTLMNPVAEDLIGWDEAETVGRPLKDVFKIINEQTGERVENPVARVLREGVIVGLANHTVLIAKDGTKRPIADSGAPIRDEEGEIIGTVLVFRDITESKRMEEELVRKEKLAILGQLAGGVGHELRNPLGVMSNAVYYLKTILPDADETTKEYLEIISSEVRNSEMIVSDLLDLSRIRPVEREETGVSELVDKTLEKQPPPEKVKVNTEIPSELLPVFVDPRQIGQVLGNLVTNACQAMPDGGKLIISAQAEKEKVSLSITDTGCGISNENMKKIFEPLFTTRARGIGLGLAVSKNLVEVNGGSIEVESEEGKGSTFTVILPIKEAVS